MLEVKNLSTSLKVSTHNWVEIVRQISFSIRPGEIFALIGESGSGKTITALSLMRLLQRKMGFSAASQIMLQEKDLLEMPEQQMRKIRGGSIAMIFQDPMTSLNPLYTAGDQVLEVLRIHRKLQGHEAYVEVLRNFAAVRIKDPETCFNSYPHELSGGQQQRVMIAMALTCKPSLLIADEPTTALDVTTQAKILQLLKDLQKSEELGILLITHDLNIAALMADTIAVMQNGVIVEMGPAQEFFKNPQHAYSRKLLNSTPAMLEVANVAKPAPTILKVANLQVYFPIKSGVLRRTSGFVKAVDGVNFELRQGQTLALVGESGSGKSTVARAILGLLPQAHGVVEYEHENLLAITQSQWHKYRKDIQVIFQNPYASLNSKLRIIDILGEGLQLRTKLSNGDLCERVDQLLEMVDLKPEVKWRYPHEFSGGQRQRLCIARSLSLDPKIVICDEPTSSLDVSVQAQVLKLLLQLQKERSLTYLFISHDLNVVRAIAQNVAVMKDGKIVEQGNTEEIFESPKHQYTKNLIDAIPRLNHSSQ